MRNYEYKSVNLGLNLSESEASKPAGIKKLESAIDLAINSMEDQGMGVSLAICDARYHQPGMFEWIDGWGCYFSECYGFGVSAGGVGYGMIGINYLTNLQNHEKAVRPACHFIFIPSCSSPLDKPYKRDTLEEDMVALKKKLSEEDLATLVGYIVLKSMADDQMLGKTYEELLEEAEQVKAEMLQKEAEEKELAEKAKAEEAERIKRLGDALTVSVFDKSFAEFDYQEYIMYKFAFENKTDRDIRAFSGQLTFSDLFDKVINKINLTYDKGIPAHSTVNWNAQSDYNQFLDEDVALKNKDLENLKIKWVPEKIIFSDGGSLE